MSLDANGFVEDDEDIPEINFGNYEETINKELFFKEYEAHRTVLVEDNFLYDYQLPVISYFLDKLIANYSIMPNVLRMFTYIKDMMLPGLYAITIDYTLSQAMKVIQVVMVQIMDDHADMFNTETRYDLLSTLDRMYHDYIKNPVTIKLDDQYIHQDNVNIIKTLVKKNYTIYITIDRGTGYSMDNVKSGLEALFKKVAFVDISINTVNDLVQLKNDVILGDDGKGFDMMYSDSPSTLLQLTNSEIKPIYSLAKMLFVPEHKVIHAMQLTNKKALDVINKKLRFSNIMIIPIVRRKNEEIRQEHAQ